ncbi:type IV pilin protein [Lysobacter sp. CAU 1642]|uniref:Type IV pilin protein n=1 Tax=Pseudomarimonas salicorniae TaxID=2933270 RepID=A0ABT0GFA0_9GAMM|nr:type IV pilin protein [Lysobacter sp. CAU 1642]
MPAYNEQVRRTRRTTATGELLSVAQGLERFHTVNNTYVATAGDATAVPPTSDSNALCDRVLDFYTVSCETITRNTFEVRAAPTGAQADDKCGTFTLTQAGVKGLVDADPGITTENCDWR